MKNILLILLCLLALGSRAQTTSNNTPVKTKYSFGLKPIDPNSHGNPDFIKKLIKIFFNRHLPYKLTFSDSVKLLHPYITNGESVGILTVTNSKYPNCKLNYYVCKYTDRDSIYKQILHFYSLREGLYFAGPYKPVFYIDGYVYFAGGWVGGDIAAADDRVKYMSIYIADEMDMYMKYDNGKY